MTAARNTSSTGKPRGGGRSRRVENSPDAAAPATAKPGGAKPDQATEPTGPPPEVAPADPAEKPAPNVIVALSRVMRDMPGIGKNRQASAKQGGYAYRGIEDITPHTQTLFARHCVIVSPRVTKWEIRPITVGGNPWMDVVEEVEYDVYGPGGPTDKIVVGPVLAIGRDNTDKGGNKCLTQAEKYVLIQLFQIADRDSDADGTTHVASSVEGHHRGQGATVDETPPHQKRISNDEIDRLVALVKGQPDEVRALIREQWTHVDPMDDQPFLPVDDQGRPHFGLLTEHMVKPLESMVARLAKAHQGGSTAPQPTAPAAGPETPPAPDAGQEKPNGGPTSWNEIIDAVRLLPEEDVAADLRKRRLLEDDMEPARMRAVLVNDIGTKAGLALADLDARKPQPADPDPGDVPFDGSGGDAAADDEEGESTNAPEA